MASEVWCEALGAADSQTPRQGSSRDMETLVGIVIVFALLGLALGYFAGWRGVLWASLASLFVAVSAFTILPTYYGVWYPNADGYVGAVYGLAIPVLAGGFSACTILGAWMRGPQVDLGHCRECGYNLAGLPEPRCPECGTKFDPNATEQPDDDPFDS